MGNFIKKAVKSVSRGFKSIAKDPLGTLTLGGLSTNAILKGLGLNSINFTQAGLMGAAGFLVGGPVGGAAGLGLSVAQQGVLGRNIQDIATMGASAQARYNQRLMDIYNSAQQQQALMIKEQNERSLLQSIRAQRIARSINLTDYASEEGVVSSGALGNLGSIGSQWLSNSRFAVSQANYQNKIQTIMNNYNMYKARAENNAMRWSNRKGILKLALGNFNASGWFSGEETAEELPTYEGIDFSISPGSKK